LECLTTASTQLTAGKLKTCRTQAERQRGAPRKQTYGQLLVPWRLSPGLLEAILFECIDGGRSLGTRTPIREYIDRVHDLTGKPVLLADTNTMTQRPQKDQLDTTDYERSAGDCAMYNNER
jgi:hypothetical protein